MLISSETSCNFQKTSLTLLQNFTVHRRFCPAPNLFVPDESGFLSLFQKQSVALILILAFSRVLSLWMNCNFKTKWQSCQPISHLEFLNSLFGCLVVGCLRGRYRWVQECQKVASPKSSAVFGRPKELSVGHMVIGCGWPHQGKPVPLSESWTETGIFHRRESSRVELIRRTGPRVSVRTVQRCLIAAGYHWRRPARCPRLTYDHRQRRHVWARWHRNWNHQHWSHVIFADESRFSLYHCDCRARVRRHVGERRVDCCI